MVPSFEHVSSPSTDDGLVEDWDADSVRSLTLAKLSLRPGSAVDSGAPSPTLPKSTLSTCSTSTAPSSSGAPPDAPDAPEPEDAAAQCPTGLPKIQSSSSAEGTPTREELRAAELVALRERRGTLSPEEERAFEHELGDWINADHSPYEQGNASNAGSPARPVSLGRRPRSGSALSMKSRTSAGAGPETNASEREDDNSGSLAVPRDDGAQFVPAPDESASTEA